MTVEPAILKVAFPPPPLAPGVLHVHLGRCVPEPADGEVLQVAERDRAQRFRNPRDGARFVWTRATLRRFLGTYTGLPPAEVPIRPGAHGKPEADIASGGLPLQFNVSHSDEAVAFVFALGGRVGVDVELVRPLKNLEGLVRHVCTPGEASEIALETAADRAAGFFRLWTRKEAIVKAHGGGISLGLRSLDVRSTPTGGAGWIERAAPDASRWTVCSLDWEPRLRLAVAAEIPPWLMTSPPPR